jgi:hypothetical protein
VGLTRHPLPVACWRWVVLDDDPDEDPIVIHAMPLRPKFHRFLR